MTLPELDWQFCGPYMVLIQVGYWKVDALEELPATVRNFLELIPDYVKQDISFKPSWTSAL
jgi:hypothetical protein